MDAGRSHCCVIVLHIIHYFFDIKVCHLLNCFFCGSLYLQPETIFTLAFMSLSQQLRDVFAYPKASAQHNVFVSQNLIFLHPTQQPRWNEKWILNWNCIFHYAFMYSAQMKRGYRSKCHLLFPLHSFFPSNTLHYGFICLLDAILVCELCFLCLWNGCSEGTPPAAHNKWDVAWQSVVKGSGHNKCPHT